MRPLIAALLLTAALPLAGCPQTSDPAGTAGQPGAPGGDPSQPGMPGMPGQPGDGAGQAAPGDGAGQAAPGDGGSGRFMPPGFASLVKDGKTVTVSGTVVGLKEAQIDFTTVRDENGQVSPEVIDIVKTTDGTFSVTAPATYEREIWVTAVPASDRPPSLEDPGGISKPFKLEGKDVTVEVTVGPGGGYLKSLPWFHEQTNGGGAPSGGPPGGGAPQAAPK